MLYKDEATKFFSDNVHRSTCAFAYGHPTKGFVEGLNKACHAGFMCPIGCTEYYSSLFTAVGMDADDIKIAEDYWRFVLGDNSPWIKGLAGIEIIFNADGRMVGYKGNTDSDGYILFNAALACRTPKESTNRLMAWSKFIEAGFIDFDALYLSHMISYTSGTGFAYSPFWNHGYPLPSNTLSYKKLSTSSPIEHKNELFSNGASNFIYCNNIWGGGVISNMPPVYLLDVPRYKGLFSSFKPSFEAKKSTILQDGALYQALRDNKEDWSKS